MNTTANKKDAIVTKTDKAPVVISPMREVGRRVRIGEQTGLLSLNKGQLSTPDALAIIEAGRYAGARNENSAVHALWLVFDANSRDRKNNAFQLVLDEYAKGRSAQTVHAVKQAVTGSIPALIDAGVDVKNVIPRAHYLAAISAKLVEGKKGGEKKLQDTPLALQLKDAISGGKTKGELLLMAGEGGGDQSPSSKGARTKRQAKFKASKQDKTLSFLQAGRRMFEAAREEKIPAVKLVLKLNELLRSVGKSYSKDVSIHIIEPKSKLQPEQ